MIIKCLELKQKEKNNYWSILLNNNLIFTSFIENLTEAKENVTKFDSIENAEKTFADLVRNKIETGYKENTFSKNKKIILERIDTIFKVQDFFEKFNLGKFLGNLELYSQKGIKIKTKGISNDFGFSRIGGMPDFPRNIEWPKTVYGEYFNFLCQINLSEISHLNSNLPQNGILYFFMGEEAGVEEDNKVIYYSGSLDDLENYDIKKLSDKNFADGYSKYMERPFSLEFEEIISIPNTMCDFPSDLEVNDDEYERYMEMVNLLEKKENENIHYMFNFPFYQSDNPRDMENELSSEDFHNKGVCLLSLKYDNNLGFCFGDAGDLNFIIKKNDLKKLNFDNIYCKIESS